MGGMQEDLLRQIDEEKARQQQKKAQDAQEKAKQAVKAAEAAKRSNSTSIFF
jgi:hypothetical protein